LALKASRQLSFATLSVHFKQQLLKPGFATEQMVTNFYTLGKQYDRQLNTTIGATLLINKINTTAQVQQHTLVNYIYWDSTYQLQQATTPILITQLNIDNTIKYASLRWHNRVLLQAFDGAAPINLPQLAAFSQLAINTKLFKQKLHTYSGIEAQWNSTYAPSQYLPFVNAFGLGSNYYKVLNYPMLNVFANAKVSTFRIYVIAQDVLQPLFITNRIMAPLHPSVDINFKVGFIWQMIN
jgi:hypothetical protein